MSKRALVTGASSGIGLEFARILARGGYDLVLIARRKKELEEIANELNARYETKVQVIVADLSRPSAAEKVYTQAVEKGEIEVLINNAGFGDKNYFKDADWDKLARMINLNILTLTNLAHLVSKDMAERGKGYILNVASTAAYVPGPLMSVYHATKAYVYKFSVALHRELKKDGVVVTSLNPGVTRSQFQHAANLDNAKFVSNRDKMMTAYEAAQAGYQGMMDGRAVVVPSARVKAFALSSHLLPPRFSSWMIYRIYKRDTKDESDA